MLVAVKYLNRNVISGIIIVEDEDKRFNSAVPKGMCCFVYLCPDSIFLLFLEDCAERKRRKYLFMYKAKIPDACDEKMNTDIKKTQDTLEWDAPEEYFFDWLMDDEKYYFDDNENDYDF